MFLILGKRCSVVQGNPVDAQGVLIRLMQIGFATGTLVSLAILLLQVCIAPLLLLLVLVSFGCPFTSLGSMFH